MALKLTTQDYQQLIEVLSAQLQHNRITKNITAGEIVDGEWWPSDTESELYRLLSLLRKQLSKNTVEKK